MNKVTISKSEIQNEKLELGQIFVNEKGGFYILCRVSNKKYALINIQSGDRWSDCCQSLERAFGVSRNYFRRVYDPIIVTPDNFNLS